MISHLKLQKCYRSIVVDFILLLFLQIINKEFDSIPFDGLLELLKESSYFNAGVSDAQDLRLLESLLDVAVNESVLTTNR